MPTVMFENPNAIFNFDVTDVIDHLKYYSNQNVHEANKLLDAGSGGDAYDCVKGHTLISMITWIS
jgi:hypothetical protein